MPPRIGVAISWRPRSGRPQLSRGVLVPAGQNYRLRRTSTGALREFRTATAPAVMMDAAATASVSIRYDQGTANADGGGSNTPVSTLTCMNKMAHPAVAPPARPRAKATGWPMPRAVAGEPGRLLQHPPPPLPRWPPWSPDLWTRPPFPSSF